MSVLVDDMSNDGMLIDEPIIDSPMNQTYQFSHPTYLNFTSSNCTVRIICSSCSLPFEQHTKCMSKACMVQQKKEQPDFDLSFFFNFKWWKF